MLVLILCIALILTQKLYLEVPSLDRGLFLATMNGLEPPILDFQNTVSPSREVLSYTASSVSLLPFGNLYVPMAVEIPSIALSEVSFDMELSCLTFIYFT